MARLRLSGWLDDDKTDIRAENRSRATHGTISVKYIRKEKVKEMEEYGYCYVNQPNERMV